MTSIVIILITEENILQVLRGFNRWWETNVVSDEFFKPIKRFAYFEARQAFEHVDIRRHVILTGSRRVGKSTIMYQFIHDLLERGVKSKNIIYVSFDHPILKMSTMDHIIRAFINNIALGSEIYLFLDEIQYAADWNGWLTAFPPIELWLLVLQAPYCMKRCRKAEWADGCKFKFLPSLFTNTWS